MINHEGIVGGGGHKYTFALYLNPALVGNGSPPRNGRFTAGQEIRHPVQKLGWVLGPVRTGTEYLAPPEFKPQTVQPVTSRYTEYANSTTIIKLDER
jgi:hypothetical protein